MNFSSDNWAGVSPAILDAMVAANHGLAAAYGNDAWTARARAAFAVVFGCPVALATVPTGTAANSLAIEMMCGRDGILVSHEEAHLVSVEADSRPILNPGVRLVGLKGVGGKLDAGVLDACLAGLAGQGRRIGVSLTTVTEAGLVYAPGELAALAAVAHRHGAMVHVDGARFGNAVASLGVAPAAMSVATGVDLLSFGATKNGALAAEALIAFDPALEPAMIAARKAFGYTFSKGRFIAVQLEAYLAEGHWLDLAGRANRAAGDLADVFGKAGVRLAWPRQANEVFAVLDQARAEALRAAGARCYDWNWTGNLPADVGLEQGQRVVRFVCSFATTPAEIAALAQALAATG